MPTDIVQSSQDPKQGLAGQLEARQLAFLTLRHMDRKGSYANIALDRSLTQSPHLSAADRHLITELVYGITRRCRTLDALITRYGSKPADQQPPDLRRILHIGFYQLSFLSQIPASAAVNTSVELTRLLKLGRLSGVVNGILRAFLRDYPDPSQPLTPQVLNVDDQDPLEQLAILHSYPDWLITLWHQILPITEINALCTWFNHPPQLDFRVNTWLRDPANVQRQFQEHGILLSPIEGIPTALRLATHVGDITQLPGFAEGHWSIQDSSAQQVVHLLDPQPGDRILDCCAAPGGKTTHCAEQMQNQGHIWALDRHAGRLKRIQANAHRLQLTCIETHAVDLASPITDLEPDLPAWGSVDRVLVDVPCSGLGTLHRHADARWRQSPDSIEDLLTLQARILAQSARWVKPGGILVYSTCTLNPDENERQIEHFLQPSVDWQLDGILQTIWPHHHHRDGFFMAKLLRLR